MSWLSSEPPPRAPSRTSRPPLQVTGDTTPPNIVPPGEAGALAISANSIDTARSSESVEFTIRVRDAGSPVNIAASSVVYSNGSTNVSGAWTRLSGEDNDGTYQVALSFAEGIPSGTYGLLSITLVDDLGNHQTYSPASLQGVTGMTS